MELTAYCENLAEELTGWKAKIDGIVVEIDRLPSGDKERLVPQVNELHGLIEELDDRIQRLNQECSDEWSPDKIELETKLDHITNASEEMWQEVPGGYVGG